MRRVRFGVIGVGAGVFKMHKSGLQSDRIEVVGVSDVNLQAAAVQAEVFGCPFFADHGEMLAATGPEAVCVLAPHPFHAALTLDALAAGAHVLVEKPMAVQVAEADLMIEAAERAGRLLAVNLQQRTRSEIRTANRLIQSGRLGDIQRVEMVAIWTRTARYYARAGWRGTWQGEGGGVLMNQSPHSLDLVCHLVGQPGRVVAWNRTQFHAIETEDTSMAMLEWPNDALGMLLVSTAQAGEAERLEIAGTRGILELFRGGVRLLEAETDLHSFLAESDDPFGKPLMNPTHVSVESGRGEHTDIYANFLDAIQHGAQLVADGEEGRMSLELANAMIYSSHTGQPVSLPLERSAYSTLLDKLRSGSR
ncbi:MAG: Gfo/Idh/MocA family protein [Chloroflexota bacterium]